LRIAKPYTSGCSFLFFPFFPDLSLLFKSGARRGSSHLLFHGDLFVGSIFVANSSYLLMIVAMYYGVYRTMRLERRAYPKQHLFSSLGSTVIVHLDGFRARSLVMGGASCHHRSCIAQNDRVWGGMLIAEGSVQLPVTSG
jgi:hypothetical protein